MGRAGDPTTVTPARHQKRRPLPPRRSAPAPTRMTRSSGITARARSTRRSNVSSPARSAPGAHRAIRRDVARRRTRPPPPQIAGQVRLDEVDPGTNGSGAVIGSLRTAAPAAPASNSRIPAKLPGVRWTWRTIFARRKSAARSSPYRAGLHRDDPRAPVPHARTPVRSGSAASAPHGRRARQPEHRYHDGRSPGRPAAQPTSGGSRKDDPGSHAQLGEGRHPVGGGGERARCRERQPRGEREGSPDTPRSPERHAHAMRRLARDADGDRPS